MTLRNLAKLTHHATIIQIIPDYDLAKSMRVHAIAIEAATVDHNPDIAQYAYDPVIGIFTSNTELNELRVVVKHKED